MDLREGCVREAAAAQAKLIAVFLGTTFLMLKAQEGSGSREELAHPDDKPPIPYPS